MVDVGLLQSLSYVAAAIGVCAAAVYYMMVLKEQRRSTRLTLESRHAQLFMQIYTQSLNKEFIRQWFAVKDFEYKGLEDFRERYGIDSNPEFYFSFISITNYLDGLGVLVKRGIMDPALVTDMMGSYAAWWLRIVEPYVKDIRVAGAPDYFVNGEYLVNEMVKVKKREGAFYEWSGPGKH